MKTIIEIALMLSLGWLPEYAWYDHQSQTATPGGKPGGGGLIGTGGIRSGGVRCDHCHIRPVPGPSGHIDAGVTFTPTLVNGQYALGTSYTIQVRMLGEHRRGPLGHSEDGFAGDFELPDGGVAGSLISDTPGFNSTACVATLPATLPTMGTTITYKDCKSIINRAVQDNTTWNFTWVAPSANEGDVTFWFGMVDANGNDRTVQPDGGQEDDVCMGKVLLRHP